MPSREAARRKENENIVVCWHPRSGTKVLRGNSGSFWDDEKEHVAELTKLLKELDPTQEEKFKKEEL